MSQGMFGLLPLSKVRGPRNTLDERLAGPNGPLWLQRLNRMLGQEMTIPYGDGKDKEELLLEAEKHCRIHLDARAFILSEEVPLARLNGESDMGSISSLEMLKSNTAVEALSRQGYILPTAEDALRFAALYPDRITGEQKVFICGKGSGVWDKAIVLRKLEGVPSLLVTSCAQPDSGGAWIRYESGAWPPNVKFMGRKGMHAK